MDGDFLMGGSDFHATLCRALRKLRLMHGYSQDALGAAIGCSRSTYTYYEMGKTVPSLETLILLARLYRVDIRLFWSEDFINTNQPMRKRPPKLLPSNPEKIAHLTNKEKTLVALLRARDDDGLLLDSFLEVLKGKDNNPPSFASQMPPPF